MLENLNGARLLLILATTNHQTALQLAAASGLSPAPTLHELVRLVEQGFVIIADAAGAITVYRLNAKGVRTKADPQRRILLIEDNVVIQEMMQLLLEDNGYTVVVARTPADATTLLAAVAFDLVITDGFSTTPAAVITNTQDVLAAAGATPVALFSAHRIELDTAHTAGFHDLISKPFDLDTLEHQVRILLQ